MEPDAAQKLLRGPVERDGDLIRGVVGLSLNEFSHSFTVGDHRLCTWCALDPLFIASAVGGDASTESRDPHDDQPISMEVRGGVVESFSPEDAVVSVVVPAEDDAFGSAQRVWMMFCDHVGFSSSEASGEAHFAGRRMEVYFLSIPEAYKLSRITFANLYAAASES
ncbi:MAG TPA: organomercurial lyase [Dehalococcoidia bacterium]|jgi:hypothetical protein|nr:organomercurial lyase [Dehalococcoidia bacterium]